MSNPQKPNILITGTPGTGKTTLAARVASALGLRHVNVGEEARIHNFYEGYNNEFQTHYLHEDKLLDHLEDQMVEGGNVVDYHTCDLFPERWFHLVIVLQATTENIFDRLTKRGYSPNKVGENVECEIMMIVAQEADDSYEEEIVRNLPSNDLEDLERNINTIGEWYQQICANYTA
eukprot:TRINITY_DN2190_c0_g1_i1.p1 TRINITY_DN2190_c0_g1~~TRINITY_DN2190_c0_g1_i1.p1  ORF type:complete len:176 (+),score=21.34 TRINITY_DN2190_c0_g1_i1:322-849(+)